MALQRSSVRAQGLFDRQRDSALSPRKASISCLVALGTTLVELNDSAMDKANEPAWWDRVLTVPRARTTGLLG
jgi:hypothetical protein